jgi:hypothetical protein
VKLCLITYRPVGLPTPKECHPRSQRVCLVVRPPCAAYIATTFESPLSCVPHQIASSPLWLMGAPRAHRGLRRTPLRSARPPIAAGVWYNHLGGRLAVLGARVAGLISVNFCLLLSSFLKFDIDLVVGGTHVPIARAIFPSNSKSGPAVAHAHTRESGGRSALGPAGVVGASFGQVFLRNPFMPPAALSTPAVFFGGGHRPKRPERCP